MNRPADDGGEMSAHIHADMVRYCDGEITKIVLGSALSSEELQAKRGSYLGDVVHVEMCRQNLIAQAQKFMESYGIPEFIFGKRRHFDPGFGNGKDQRPKWGQPGRRRKRAMRLEARRKNEASQ